MARVVTGLALVALLTGAFPSSSRYPAFIPPTVNGVTANIFADFTTEGTSNHYWYLGKQYGGETAWCAAVPGCTFSRVGNATYTNSSGNLVQASANVLRFDYDPVSLIPKGILLEGGSTNLITQSGALTNGAWAQNNATVTGSVTGPDGTASAFHIAENNANSTHTISNSAGTVSAGTYTWSTYLKAAERTQAYLSDGSGSFAVFDLSNGIVLSGAGTITPAVNGWYRCTLTVTYGTSATAGYIIAPTINASAGGSYLGTTGNGINATFAQVEASPFATSYIPTAGSTASRNQDNFSATPISAWFSGSSGTLLNAADIPGTGVGQTQTYIGDGSDNTRLQLSFSSNLSAFGANGGTSVFSLSSVPPNPYVLFRQAVSYSSGNNQSFFASDGTNVGSGTMSSAITGATQLNIGINPSDLHPTYGHIGTFGFWPTTASSGTLQSLTAPPSWAPTAVGVLPSVLADFAGQNYMVNGYVVPTLAAWESETGTTVTRASPGTFVGSNGLIQTATNNVLRFDYDPVALTPKGALLETTSTNLALQSNTFSTTWTTNALTLGSTTTSPDGTSNATKLQEDNTNNVHVVLQTVTPAAGSATVSAYFEPAERTAAIIRVLISGTTPASVSCGLSGSGSTSVLESGGSAAGSIARAGSGFYRCSLTYTSAGAGDVIEIGPNDGTHVTYSGVTGDGVYAYGAQAEAQSFASSYIATTTGSVNRFSDQVPVRWTSPSVTILAKTTIINGVTNTGRIVGASFNSDAPIFIGGSANVGNFQNTNGSISVVFTGNFFTGAVKSVSAGSSGGRLITANGASPVSDANPEFDGAVTFLPIASDVGMVSNYSSGDYATFGLWPVTATGGQAQTLSTLP